MCFALFASLEDHEKSLVGEVSFSCLSCFSSIRGHYMACLQGRRYRGCLVGWLGESLWTVKANLRSLQMESKTAMSPSSFYIST